MEVKEHRIRPALCRCRSHFMRSRNSVLDLEKAKKIIIYEVLVHTKTVLKCNLQWRIIRMIISRDSAMPKEPKCKVQKSQSIF